MLSDKKQISYWCELFERNKYDSFCLDIETEEHNGKISVLGLYRPKEGLIECEQFVKGKDLSKENIKNALKKSKLIITFSGIKFDLPKIEKEFPGAIPDKVPVLDLYLFGLLIGRGSSSLKTWENTFGIKRLHSHSEKKGIASKRWKRYLNGDEKALNELLEYNKQDTINLYFLAEEMVKEAKKNLAKFHEPYNL